MIDISVASSFDFASAEYRALLAASNATAFQHPDWLCPFYNILVPAHGVEPLVVVGRDQAGGELQLVLPLVRSGASIRYAFLDVTDYACPVMRPTIASRAGALPDKLRAALDGAPLVVSPVHQEHAADWQALLGVEPTRLPFQAHFLPLARSGGRPAHFSARRRNDLARKAGRLGALDFEIVHGDAIAEAFAEAQAFRRGRFDNDPLQLDHGLRFYCEVAARGDRSGLARTFRLSREGRTVAMLFGLIDQGHFRYIILACDYPRYAGSSPGLLVFDRAIASWAEAGGAVFDFTIGDEPYKAELGCASAPMYAFAFA